MVVAFIGYLTLFFDPIQQISQLYTTYQQGMAALDKIFDLLDTGPDMTDHPDAVDPGQLRGEIELDDVWFSYARGGDASIDEVAEMSGDEPDDLQGFAYLLPQALRAHGRRPRASLTPRLPPSGTRA